MKDAPKQRSVASDGERRAVLDMADIFPVNGDDTVAKADDNDLDTMAQAVCELKDIVNRQGVEYRANRRQLHGLEKKCIAAMTKHNVDRLEVSPFNMYVTRNRACKKELESTIRRRYLNPQASSDTSPNDDDEDRDDSEAGEEEAADVEEEDEDAMIDTNEVSTKTRKHRSDGRPRTLPDMMLIRAVRDDLFEGGKRGNTHGRHRNKDKNGTHSACDMEMACIRGALFSDSKWKDQMIQELIKCVKYYEHGDNDEEQVCQVAAATAESVLETFIRVTDKLAREKHTEYCEQVVIPRRVELRLKKITETPKYQVVEVVEQVRSM